MFLLLTLNNFTLFSNASIADFEQVMGKTIFEFVAIQRLNS